MSLAPRKSKLLDMMPWEVERRRSSMSAQSRRNSILSVSLFDFTFSPQHASRPTFDADADPFAPLSIHEGIAMTGIGRQQPNQSSEAIRFSPEYRNSYHSHLLSDRSESSAMSTPSPRYSMVGATPIAVHSRSNQIVSSGHQQYRTSYSSPVKMSATLKAVITPDQSLKSSPFGVRPVYKKQSSAAIAKLPLSNDEDDDEDDDEDEDGSHRFKAFHEEKWTFRYKELLEYHKDHGHAAVPHTFPKNPQLARWYVTLSTSIGQTFRVFLRG
jgi:Helicase associated domain